MGKRIALVIGTCTYEDPQFAALGCPEHDVRGLAAALRDEKVGGFDEVHELVDRASRDIQLEISNVFSDRENDDLVVVYISGHGYKDRGKLYFVCKDTRRARLNATGVASDFLKQEMEASAARRQVLILDCCHAGAFSQGMKSGGGVGDKAGALEELGGDASGKIVLTASDAIQYAYEGDAISGKAQNSVFTKHLLEGLRSGAADLDGDGTISVDELFDYVRLKVREERPEQRPQRSAAGESGEVYIAKSPYVKPAELNKELLEATRSKDRLVVMGSIDELWRLLEDPDPRLSAGARQRLQEMLLEDQFRSVHDKVHEALVSVTVNVVVKPKAAKVKTGAAGMGGAGSAGFTEKAKEPEARVDAGPWLRQGTGPGLVDVVLVRGGDRRAELARAIGAATGSAQSDAETFINDAPHAAFPKLNQADAKRLAGELERCGATVEIRPVKPRGGGAGGGGSDPESSVWVIPKVKEHAGGGGSGGGAGPTGTLRGPVRVPVSRQGHSSTHSAHQINDPRDAGLGSPMAAAAITGGGLALWAMIASGAVQMAIGRGMEYGDAGGRTILLAQDGYVHEDLLQQASDAGSMVAGALIVSWFLWLILGSVTMGAGLPVSWTKAAWAKRVGVGAAWGVFPPAGVGVSAWVSRDQPGMRPGKAWAIAGIWGGALGVGFLLFGMFDAAMNYSVPRWPIAGLLTGVFGAGAASGHWFVLSTARRGARRA